MRRIDIPLKASKLFILLIAATMLCCVAIVFTLPLSIFFNILLAAAVLAYGGFLLRNWGLLRGKDVITQLSYGDEGWTLTNGENIWRGELCGDSTLTPFLGILRFKLPDVRNKRSCLIFKDTIEPDLFRRLLVTARTAKIHAG
jgi:hypothetical protein